MTMTLDGSAGMTAPSGAVYNGLQTATAVSASGTSVDFTNIPVWAKRITVMFSALSTNGTSNIAVQLGSGSVETTGYVSIASDFNGNLSSTISFMLTRVISATASMSGAIVISNLTGNTWVESGILGYTDGTYGDSLASSGGTKTLAGVLDRVRVTTVGGTNTFDAGTINIIYE